MKLKDKLAKVQNAKTLMNVLGNKEFSDKDVENFKSLSSVETVEVHISKGNVCTNFGRAKALSEVLTKEENGLLDKNGKSDTILGAFSPELVGKFRSIEESVRRKRRELAIGNSSYMDEESFKKFLVFFEEKVREFEQAKEELKAVYSEAMQQYKDTVIRLVPKIAPHRTADIMSNLSRQIMRSADSFLADFSIRLETTFKENVVSDETLVELMRKQRNMQVYEECQTILKGLLKAAWDVSANFLKRLESSDTSDKTDRMVWGKNTLLDTSNKIKSANFLNIDTFSFIASEMERIANIPLRSVALEDTYLLLSYIYGSAVDSELEYVCDSTVINHIVSTDELLESYQELING